MVAPIETQLRLEKFEENLYRSTEKLWKPPNARGVFGGVVIAQSLMAAAHTVPDNFHVHSMHCYFIMAGDSSIPIVYHVERVRDGKSFVTRTVQAIQHGRCIFTTSISFQHEIEFGKPVISHQTRYPGQPMPREVGADSFPDSPFSPRNEDDQEVANGIKVKIIPPDRDEWISQDASQRRLRYWMKCDGTIANPKAHVMGLAYLSDSHLLGTSVIAAGYRFPDVSMMVSLDHSIYFHHPVKADEWLMHCVESPWSGQERGLTIGRFYNQDKVHIATVMQEGVLRLSDEVKSKILAEESKAKL